MKVKDSYRHPENSGILFKNDEIICETDPLFKGTAIIGGDEYFVSCFDSQTKNDKPMRKLKFISLSDVKKKGIQQAREALK